MRTLDPLSGKQHKRMVFGRGGAPSGMCNVMTAAFGVVREAHARMLSRGWDLITAAAKGWSVNQLLFGEDTAVVVDTEKIYADLGFGQVHRREKLELTVCMMVTF